MSLFTVRHFFRNLNGVRYSTCTHCGDPFLGTDQSQHECTPHTIPLTFAVTHLSNKADSTPFKERCSGRGFICELRLWKATYITALELSLLSADGRDLKKIRHGTPGERDQELAVSFQKGEFITGIQYGADVHGLYSLRFTMNNGRVLTIGQQNFPKKTIEIPQGKGLVGVFGAYSDVVCHLGFFFDDMELVNFERNRELLLIRYKGERPNSDNGDAAVLSIVKDLDQYLFRYMAKFV